jgi:uncharacterized membrane protein
MDDLAVGLVCLFLGAVPVLLIGGLFWLARGTNRGPNDARFLELERHVADLKGENMRLSDRLATVEAGLRAEHARRQAASAAEPRLAAVAAPVEAPIVTPMIQAPAEVAARVVADTAGAIESEPASLAVETEPTSEPEVVPAPAEASVAAAVVAAPVEVTAAAPASFITPPTVATPAVAASASPPIDTRPVAVSIPPGPPQEGGLERWLGVRGMAALGAIVLAIAGLYFFEYSVEHGYIGPTMRVLLGVLAGAGCLVASEWPLRRTAPVLASWLGGAGIAILYMSTWAAYGLYALVPSFIAGAMMVAVTVTAAALSLRRESLPTAVLGLVGGFVTPLALSTGEDHPIPLFAYLLLLDVGLLWVAHRRKWPLLGWLSLCATGLYELLWLFGRMSAATSLVGLAVIVVFAALFAAFAATREEDPEAEVSSSGLMTGAAILAPFLFALSFVGRDVFPPHLYAVGGLVLVLSIGSIFVARVRKLPLLALGSAAGSLGVVLAWLTSHPLDTWTAWELTALLSLLALTFHVGTELDRGSPVLGGSAIVVIYGALAIGVLTSITATTSIAPFVVLPVVLVILGARQGELPGRGWAQIGTSIGLAVAMLAVEHMNVPEGGPSPSFLVSLSLLLVTLLAVPAVLRRSNEGRAFADHGAAAGAITLLACRFLAPSALTLPMDLVAALVLSLVVHLAATRRFQPGYSGTALILIGLGATFWIFDRGTRVEALVSLGIMSGSVLLHSMWPALAGSRYRSSAWAWRAAALAGPVHFFAMRITWVRAFGSSAIGLLPVSLAAVSLLALLVARARGPSEVAARRTALVWPAAVTTAFVTLAIPLQLSNEWLTIGWALEAVALLVLFRRLDHAGLKWLATALFAAVAVRLLINPYVLGYYPRGDIRIFNWIAYTYLVPAAALVAAYVALADLEVPRLRDLEKSFYGSLAPWLSRTFFAAALVTVFVWLNLTIIDWYASGPDLTIPMERMPARDLTISIAWAGYALGLLGLGMWRESSGLRWTSLALILVTCGKVFLYDLGHLEDLYRVAALVGLAFSLLGISLVYQRFVFRKRDASEASS